MEDIVQQSHDFLEYLVKKILQKDQVQVDASRDNIGVFLQLKVDQEDMGRVVGKKGQTAKAIRHLLSIIGSKNGTKITLKILEPEGSTHPAANRDHKDVSDLDIDLDNMDV